MGLQLYNTLTQKQEDFALRGERITIYTCGLTVQGLPHLGHMRAYLVRDILVRWLDHLNYPVVSYENFTDIDDKIIEKQKSLNTDWRVIADGNVARYLDAIDRLNIRRADFYPRASQHIEEIIELIKRLIEKGFAYEEGGDVYFKVRAFPDYGKLSKKSIDELMVGARIAPTDHKQDPLDFALWKAAKPNEPYWLSPWGKGRPGWHIECSAMSMHYLGETFDIHMGGEDLIFPHHENEIAQSVAATGKPFARFWLHNGWVTLSGEKMAKSTGHYFLIEDILKDYSANVIRMYLLKTQYRNQIEFSRERLDEAKSAYLRIQTFIYGFENTPEESEPLRRDEFTAAMNDDLNTPKALGIIYDLIKEGYEEKNDEKAKHIAASVKYFLSILGFKEDAPAQPFKEVMDVFREIMKDLRDQQRSEIINAGREKLNARIDDLEKIDDMLPAIINSLLDIRNMVRKNKDYRFADHIRECLARIGIQVQDRHADMSTFRLEAR